jgi:hypothetical protein
MENNRHTARIFILTDQEFIEGTLFYPEAIRFSDAINAEAYRVNPFLPIKDARVFCRKTQKQLLRCPFFLVGRDKIIGIVPKEDAGIDWGAFIGRPDDDPLKV